MLTKLTIGQVVASQRERLEKLDPGLYRRIPDFSALTTHALVITGIRRCGKSTLLQQLISLSGEETVYVNFEDPRLAGFDLSDFNRLQELIEEKKITCLLFDEIQNIDKWENYVRFRLDERYRVRITGSNASMLSREVGTLLTGRHISLELFPFSYSEYLEFTKEEAGTASVGKYLEKGGFPEMIKTGMPEVLMQAFNDIVVRDIAVRYNIKNTSMLLQLAVFLLSNTGKLITGNSLRKLFSIGSSSSIMEYLGYFADAYLFFYVPRFSYSQKVQLVNPKKVYSNDTGLVEVNSLSFSQDKGRLLENMVFMQLRRWTKDIYYFAEKKECDLVVFQNSNAPSLYQVCWQLDNETLDREIKGISEAMEFFSLQEGTIITYNQADSFTIGNRKINVIPFYEWAIGKNDV